VKQLKHPATIIAAVALFVAFGGGAAAYASGLINGSQIKNHSIAAKKLTKSAIKSLHGAKGARGPAGPTGATGAAGAPGAAGPQGPGGAIIRWGAVATATPTFSTVGTVLGGTYKAACVTSAGTASLLAEFYTSDGSWNAVYSEIDETSSTTNSFAGYLAAPAGTLTSSAPLTLSFPTATAGGDETDDSLNFVQSGPVPGNLIWHGTAITQSSGSPTCQLVVQSIPETLSSESAAPRASTKAGTQLHIGNLRTLHR
jgi:hypothetical protein